MKNLFILIITVMSTSTFAKPSDITDFSCRTTKVIEGKKPTEFLFRVENLYTPKAELNYWAEKETEYPVTMIPKDSILMLNDNFNIRWSKGNLKLNSDGDGCQYTTVILYKDRDFKTGYVRVEDGGCGALGVPAYSTVSCRVSRWK